jgi:hypothetical protein
MPKITLLYGTSLMVLGIAGYLLTGRESGTALIPAVFGVPLIACAVLSWSESPMRKHLMHASAVIALLGFAGTIGAVRFALYMVSVGPVHVDNPAAVLSRTVMAVLSGAYLYQAIGSFIRVRREREQANT